MRSVPDEPAQQQYGTRESLTAEEFTRRASGDEGSRDRAVNQETILRNEFGVRTFGYTSFVVDPPNGQMPAMTPAGTRARCQSRTPGHSGPGPFDTFEDFTLYDRCITRGVVGSHPARALRQRRPHPSDPERSGPQLRDGARHARHSDRWTRNVGPGVKQYMGNSRGPLGGRHAGHRDERLHRSHQHRPNGNGTRHSDQMKMTEWLTRIDPADDRLSDSRRGPGDLHGALHAASDDYARSRATRCTSTPATRATAP